MSGAPGRVGTHSVASQTVAWDRTVLSLTGFTWFELHFSARHLEMIFVVSVNRIVHLKYIVYFCLGYILIFNLLFFIITFIN